MARRGKGASRRGLYERVQKYRRPGAAGVIALGLMGLMLAGAAKLRDPRTLPIRSVKVEGEFHHLSRERLVEAATPHVHGGFFSVDLNAVEQALEALPWVHSASLRRRWPDTLVVRVNEQVPVARWGEYALLNRYGDLFRPPGEELPSDLPVLSGPRGKQRELIERYLAISERLRPIGLVPSALTQDERRAWHLELVGGVRIDLGRAEQERRLSRLIAVYRQTLSREWETVRSVDLRYPNGLAVARHEAAGQRNN